MTNNQDPKFLFVPFSKKKKPKYPCLWKIQILLCRTGMLRLQRRGSTQYQCGPNLGAVEYRSGPNFFLLYILVFTTQSPISTYAHLYSYTNFCSHTFKKRTIWDRISIMRLLDQRCIDIMQTSVFEAVECQCDQNRIRILHKHRCFDLFIFEKQ